MGNLIHAHYSSFSDPLDIEVSDFPREDWLKEGNLYFIVDGHNFDSAISLISHKYKDQRLKGSSSWNMFFVENQGVYSYTQGNPRDIVIAAFSLENIHELSLEVNLGNSSKREMDDSLELLKFLRRQRYHYS